MAWLRNGQPIPGATGTRRVITVQDAWTRLSCRVRATNDAGDATATSASTLVALAPVNVAPPRITGSGRTLRAAPGTWVDGPNPSAPAYQWLRDGQPIAGATTATHRVTARERGTTLSVRVTVTNARGRASATSGGRSG
ncbi:MAG: hypothetical protein U0Y82_05935 [Thermoleophilia bacterium]